MRADDFLSDAPAAAGGVSAEDFLGEAPKPKKSLLARLFSGVDYTQQAPALTQQGPTATNYLAPKPYKSVLDTPEGDDPALRDFRTESRARRAIEDRMRPPGAQKHDVASASIHVDQGFIENIKRMARETVGGLNTSAAGLVQMTADLNDLPQLSEFAQRSAAAGQRWAAQTEAPKTTVAGFTPGSIVQGLPELAREAVPSALQQLPALLSGGAVYPVMAAQQIGQQYNQLQGSGLATIPRTLNALGSGAFEVIGEKFGGTPGMIKAGRAALAGNPVEKVARQFGGAVLHDIPGEQLTNTGQYLTDAAPFIGSNANPNLDEYLQQAKQTLGQTIAQGGLLSAGGIALAKARNAMGPGQNAPLQAPIPFEATTPPAAPPALPVAPVSPAPAALPPAPLRAAPAPAGPRFFGGNNQLSGAIAGDAQAIADAASIAPTRQSELDSAIRAPAAEGTAGPITPQSLEALMVSLGLAPAKTPEVAMNRAAPEVAPAPAPEAAPVSAEAFLSQTPEAAPASAEAFLNAPDSQPNQPSAQSAPAQAAIENVATPTPQQQFDALPANPDQAGIDAAMGADIAGRVAQHELPRRYGVGHVPMDEGGKVFQTRRQAKQAKRLQPALRVIATDGGYVLGEKSDAQLAADERAARRLGRPQIGQAGQPIAAHEMIAGAGGMAPGERADMGMEGNVRIGNRSLFAGAGKGLTMERTIEKLIEEGYLPEDASHQDARDLIKRSLTNPQYNADGWEQAGQMEQDARQQAHEDAMMEEALQAEKELQAAGDEGYAEFFDNIRDGEYSYQLGDATMTEQDWATLDKEWNEQQTATALRAQGAGQPEQVTAGRAQPGDRPGAGAPGQQAAGEGRTPAPENPPAVDAAGTGQREGQGQAQGVAPAKADTKRHAITPEDAANFTAGQVIEDADGKQYQAHGARHGYLEAFPIVDGKPVVHNQSKVRFHLDPQTASAYPERRHDPVFAVNREAQRIPTSLLDLGFKMQPNPRGGQQNEAIWTSSKTAPYTQLTVTHRPNPDTWRVTQGGRLVAPVFGENALPTKQLGAFNSESALLAALRPIMEQSQGAAPALDLAGQSNQESSSRPTFGLQADSPEAMRQREEDAALAAAQQAEINRAAGAAAGGKKRALNNAELEKRAAKIRKERADAAVDDFAANFGGEAPSSKVSTEQAAGQGGMFDNAPAPKAEPAAAPKETSAQRNARLDAEMLDAMGELGDIFSKPFKANITPEQEQKLGTVLAKVLRIAFDKGYLKFKDAAKYALDRIRAMMGDDLANALTIEHLQGAYISAMSGKPGAESARNVVNVESKAEVEAHTAVSQPNENDLQEPDNAASTRPRVERDSGQPAAAPAVQNPVQDDGRGDDQGNSPAAGQDGARPGGRQQDGAGVPADSAAPAGERSDIGVHRGDGIRELEDIVTGADFSERGPDVGLAGIPIERIPARQVEVIAETGAKKSGSTASTEHVTPGDIGNIRDTLPQLFPPQHDDVLKTEQRFAQPEGHGMLFTNGTGTGKTFTGLGVIKRFALQGKNNILIAVPDGKIASDWLDAGKLLGLDITQLESKQDAGKGVVLTTYANLGDNDALAARQWDLVVTDEAHKLMQAADGTVTDALQRVRALTYHPESAIIRYQMLNRADIDKSAEIHSQIKHNDKIRNMADTMDAMRADLQLKNAALEHQAKAIDARLREAMDAMRAEVKARQGAARPRLLALSATPFAYEKTIDWANGYLFNYKDGYPYNENSTVYNQPSPREYYFQTRFGYTMRTNKLSEPDRSKIDSGLLQRQFNSELKKAGSLSGRMLDVKPDYDRRFVLVESAIGNKIDEAMDWLQAQASAAYEAQKDVSPAKRDTGMSALRNSILDQFNWQSKRYLLEAIKAEEAVDIARQHMAMGRKVVIYHDYKKGGEGNPFEVELRHEAKGAIVGVSAELAESNRQGVRNFNAAAAQFQAKFGGLINDLNGLRSPIHVFTQDLPGTLLVNGDQKKPDLLKNYRTFQDDASGPQVMLVQSAKNAGWSGHDTTGKHQRVLINLGQPTAPTLAIQQEGRIYRQGQASNAIIRYLNTGTNWERWTFATTIATRASTAENLGMGELSRALKDSFIDAFEESDSYPPGHEGEGLGGKERDKAANNAISEYDRAKTQYWAQQKKNSRTKAQEGTDYFATPEPVGLKMVQWLDLRTGESSAEPSAGHGAIARWLPQTTRRTVIEPSIALRSRLALAMEVDPAKDRIIDGNFEDHAIVNKYDGIAMNPPFGTAGRTAIDHLAKAALHLRDGGRIVALLPDGPSANAKFDKWYEEPSTKPARPLGTSAQHGMFYKGDTLTFSGFGRPSTMVVEHVDGTGTGPRYVRGKDTPKDMAINVVAIDGIAPGPRQGTSYSPTDDLFLIASIKLPGVTFSRAGTGVMTRIVILEKQTDRQAAIPPQRNRDYSDITDINELFNRLEDLTFAPRAKVQAPELAPIAVAPATPAAPVKAARPAKAQAVPGNTVLLGGKSYPVENYTTANGKLKTGAWVETKEIAAQYSKFAFRKIKDGNQWWVGDHGFPKDALQQADAAGQAEDGGAVLQNIKRIGTQLARQGYEPAEVPRVQAARALQKAIDQHKAGTLDGAEFTRRLEYLASRMREVSDTKASNSFYTEITRGVDYVRERLLQARRRGDLDPEAVEFALWALDKNPDLANNLGISVRKDTGNAAGNYNPAAEIIRLFKDSDSHDTAVHEILHHAERMMPEDMQAAIRKEWARALADTIKRATPEQAALLENVPKAVAGDRAAYELLVKAIQDGRLNYAQHYQLVNPSEFWAVNGSRLMSAQFAARNSVWQRAKVWFSEMVQKVKGLLGLRSDAPILKALAHVTDQANFGVERGGRFESARMLSDPKAMAASGGVLQAVNKSTPAAPAPWDVSVPDTKDAFIRAIQNNKIDVQRVSDAIEKQFGRLADQVNVTMNQTLYAGAVAARVKALHKLTINPLLAKLAVAGKNAGITTDDLNEYLHARHAPERNHQMQLINPDMVDNEALSGMSNLEADNVIARFIANGKAPGLRVLAKDVYQLLSDTRTAMVADGLESAQTVAAWEASYHHYVPLQRDIEGAGTPKGQGVSVRGPEAKRAVGSNREVVNILANIVTQAETEAIRAEKSITGRTLLAMARQYPNPAFWTVDIKPMKPRINPETGLVDRTAIDPLYQSADNVVMIKDYGAEHFVVFNKNNPRAKQMARNMKNLDMAELSALTQAAAHATRFMASLLTARNPVFWGKNFARDIQAVMVNLEGTDAQGLQHKVLANLPNAFKGMHEYIRKGTTTTKNARDAKLLFDTGGTTGYMQAFGDSDERMKDLKAIVAQMGQGKADPRRLARTALDFIDDYNEIIENATRLSVFQTARDAGVSTRRAAVIAKEITIDFNRRGNLSPGINGLYMFFNAGVQGTAQLAKVLATSPSARVLVGMIATMGFMQDLIGRMMASDDDDTGRNRYDLIPEYIKSRNWIFMNPMRPGEWVEVPLPIGPHVFHNAGRLLSDALFRKDPRNAAEYGAAMAGILFDAFSPLGAAPSFAQLALPSLADPIQAIAENKTFSGSAVYKSDEKGFGHTDPKPAYTRHFENTPSVWKAASRGLNDITGGDKDKKGVINWEPDLLKFVFYTITGGPGRTLDQALDATQSQARGVTPTVNRIPLVSSFYGVTDDQMRERAYYDDKKRVSDAQTQRDFYNKAGRRELAMQVETDLGDGDIAKGRRMIATFAATGKTVAMLNKEIRARLDKSDAGSDEADKLKALKERRTGAMGRAVRKADQGASAAP
jgi:hypothetical protein